jgi:hypothetical protein
MVSIFVPPVLLLSLVLVLVVVVPAVWSSDETRREAACRVLRMILTAFGRRPVD